MKFQTDAPEEHRGAARVDPDREPTREEYWAFFDMLRDTGKTNMMGAPRYAEFYLDVPKARAEEAFWDWVDLPNKQSKLEALIDGNPAQDV